MAIHPRIEPEDQARLAWIAAQFSSTPTEVASLGVAWFTRHLQGMVAMGIFQVEDFRRLQQMFMNITVGVRCPRSSGLTLELFDHLCMKYWGRTDLYGEARAELARLLHYDEELIPDWVVSYAIWGFEDPGCKPRVWRKK